MAIKKNDFIEIEFTGKIKDTEDIFDTNVKEDAKKADLQLDIEKLKPFILSVGNQMLPVGFDEDLEGKEVGKEYSIDVKAEKAFGKRNPQMTRMIPLKIFHEQNIQPQRGMQLNLGGQLARILSSSGGRVLVDFNNPLAGKDVNYKYKILRVVENQNEKVDALQDFLFRKKFPFSIKEKTVTFNLKKEEEQLKQFVEMMAKPFEEILGLKVASEISEKKEEKESDKKE